MTLAMNDDNLTYKQAQLSAPLLFKDDWPREMHDCCLDCRHVNNKSKSDRDLSTYYNTND